MKLSRKTTERVVVVMAVLLCCTLGGPAFGARGNPGGERGAGDAICDGGGPLGNGQQGGRQGNGDGGEQLAAYIAELPSEVEPSEVEVEYLILMREEEKLARDVYLELFDIWEAPIFKNIARSEQRHADAVGALLEKYELDDPFIDEVGVFTDPDLQTLFDDLVAAGKESLVAALTVGATIEDLDIFDLAHRALPAADKEDIRMVYQNLLKGSRNHMRAFVRELEAQGAAYDAPIIGDYDAPIIGAEELAAILAAPHERGLYDADGELIGDVGDQNDPGGNNDADRDRRVGRDGRQAGALRQGQTLRRSGD